MPIASIEAGASHMQYRPQLTGCPALAHIDVPTTSAYIGTHRECPGQGVHTVIQAFEFKKAGFSNWTVLLILGLLTVLFAAGSFIDPAISAISITLLVGIALISRGVNRFVFLSGIGRLL